MSNIGDIYGKVINGVNSLVIDSSNLNVNANLNINGIIALNDITNTNITNASLYGTQGQVLTCGTDACGNLGLPFWSDGASGSGSGSGLPTSGTSGQILMLDNSNQAVWSTVVATSVYFAADANNTSPASDGFITYLPSPITKNSTFINNAFSPGRIGDYKVTSNLTFTGGSATVRIGKPDSSLSSVTSSSNPISNFLQRSYDFRNVTATTYSTTSSLTFTDSSDPATVTLESGSATFSSGSGYQGASNHYINLTASDWTFPSAFSIELFFKLGANSDYHSVFDAYDSATSRRIALMRQGTTSNTLSLWIDNVGSGVEFTFPINESQFEHVILRFNGTDVPQAYVNGAAVTLTHYQGNWGTSLTSASTGTKNNVILGRNPYHYNNFYLDNGTEEIKLVAWYNTAVTAAQVSQLYEHHVCELNVLSKSSGSGTVITHAIAQQLATTDSIKVHAEGSFTGYSGDAALIVEHIDGSVQGPQGPQGLGFPDISGTSGQILMLDNSNQAVWSELETSTVYYEATLEDGRITSVSIQSGATDLLREDSSFVTGGTSTTGSEQLFDINVVNGIASVSIKNSGKNFSVGDTITIPASSFVNGVDNLVLEVMTVTDLKIQCSSQPSFVNLTSWHVPANSSVVSHPDAFAFNNSNKVFVAPRNGRYRVHMRTALKETTTVERALQMTQRLYKPISLIANSVYDSSVHSSIPDPTYSFDFRRANSGTGTGNTRRINFSTATGTAPSNGTVDITIDSGASFPSFPYSSTDGYPGTTSHFLDFNTNEISLRNGSSTQYFALEFYVKMPNIAGGYHTLLGCYSNTLSNYVIWLGSDANMSFWLAATQTNGTYNSQVFNLSSFYTENNFDHVVFVYDGFNIRLYRNASLIHTQQYALTTQKPSAVNIGRDGRGQYDSGPENVRFFRYYDRSLTDDEVTTLYNAHVHNEAKDIVTTYRANKAALYGSVGSTGETLLTNPSFDQSPLSTTFQFEKLVYLDANDVLAIDQNTDNRGTGTGLADNALEFIPGESALIIQSTEGVIGLQGQQGPQGLGFPDISGTSGQILMLDNSNQAVWSNVDATSVYIAADANNTTASDGFITYLPSPITKNSTLINNAFSPGRIGDYKVTSNLTFTGGSATVRVGRFDSSSPITPTRQYDFRNAAGTYSTTSALTFTDSSDTATVTLDSGSATISSGNGYQGASNHYIAFPQGTTDPQWAFSSAFTIELLFKFGSVGNSHHSVFEAFDTNVSNRLALMRNGTTSNSMQFEVKVNANFESKYTFYNDDSAFTHLLIRFNGTDTPIIYTNGNVASTSASGNAWTAGTTSIATGARSNVWLGRNAYHPNYAADNGTEEIKLVAYYDNFAVTATEAMQMYERRFFELDVLGKTSGSGTVITHAIAQQLATTDSIKVHAEGSFTGYSGDAALIVENVDGGLQGPRGLGFPDISGTTGQILMLDNSNPPEAIWSNPVNKHGHATYLTNEGGLNYNYTNEVSIISVNGGVGSTGLSNVSDVTDTGYTSLTGMGVTYNPVGVTFVPSTTALTTANGTVTFSNNPSSLPPSRWRINTTGHYRVKACVMVTDYKPGYRLQIYLWRRSGGTAQYAGTTVTLIGFQSTLEAEGSIDLGMSVQVEGIYSLSEFDEIYCSVNGDTGTKYQAYLATYFTIHSVDGVQGPQGPAGTGLPDISGTSGQILMLDNSNPPQAFWSTGGTGVYCSIRANASTSVGDGSLYTSWDSTNAVTSESSIVSSTIPFIAPRAGTYYVHFYTTVKCPTSSEWSAVRLVRYVSGGSEVKVAQTRHSEIDSGTDWRPHSMSAIVTLANDERLGVRIFSGSGGNSSINQDGTLTELTVHSMEGITGPQGPAGTGLPDISGTSGQILMLDNSNPPEAIWSNLVFDQKTNHNVITLDSNPSANPIVIENAFTTTAATSSTLTNSIVLKGRNNQANALFCVRVVDDVIDAMTYTANSNSTSGHGLYLNYYSGQAVYTPNGSVYQGSDDRIKFDEQDISNGLSLMRQVKPQKYIKRRPGESGLQEWGFIAQDIEQLSDISFAVTQPEKEWVEGDPNTRYKYLDYQPLYIAAIAAIKELDTQVQQLTARIQALETPQ